VLVGGDIGEQAGDAIGIPSAVGSAIGTVTLSVGCSVANRKRLVLDASGAIDRSHSTLISTSSSTLAAAACAMAFFKLVGGLSGFF
jgi:hypothetical protein